MNHSGISANIIALASLAAIGCIKPAAAAGCHTLSRSSLENKAQNYEDSIRSASRSHGVQEDLIKAVIAVESCFKSTARGTSGEKGLMQLMPGTAARFNVRSGYNPWDNVHGGASYLKHLIRYYKGDTRRAIAAYNAGEGNVRPGGVIRNKDYVRKVMSAYSTLSGQGAYKHSRKAQGWRSASYKKRTSLRGSQRYAPRKPKVKYARYAAKTKPMRFTKQRAWLKQKRSNNARVYRASFKPSKKMTMRAKAARLAKKRRSKQVQASVSARYARALPASYMRLNPGDTIYTIVESTIYTMPLGNHTRRYTR